MSMLLERNAMLDPLQARIDDGLPVFGTCAGMILLSDEILDGRPTSTVWRLPISTRRNGTDARSSFEAALSITGLADRSLVIFIRAPIVDSVDADVAVLGGWMIIPLCAGTEPLPWRHSIRSCRATPECTSGGSSRPACSMSRIDRGEDSEEGKR